MLIPSRGLGIASGCRLSLSIGSRGRVRGTRSRLRASADADPRSREWMVSCSRDDTVAARVRRDRRRSLGSAIPVPGDSPSWVHEMFLVRCPGCGSRLIQPVDVVGPVGGSSIVTRYCPECDWQDAVVAEDIAIQVWLRRDERTKLSMTAIANLLAAATSGRRIPARPGGEDAAEPSPLPS
jgi:hypothetical protein